MKLLTCEKHTIVWVPGDDEYEPNMVGVFCPACESEKFRMEFNQLIENLEYEREKIEKSGEPCPLCGCVGSHEECYKKNPDLCCILGDKKYWDLVKGEWG